MLPSHRVATHPGEILLEEFLVPLNLSQAELARHLGVPIQRVNEIVKGKRGITAETAWLLADAFRMTPEFWMHAQAAYDLTLTRDKRRRVAPLVPEATVKLEEPG